jgi:hypothetical protein
MVDNKTNSVDVNLTKTESLILESIIDQKIDYIFSIGLHAYVRDYRLFEPLHFKMETAENSITIGFRLHKTSYDFCGFIPTVSELREPDLHFGSEIEEEKAPTGLIGFEHPFLVSSIDIYQSVCKRTDDLIIRADYCLVLHSQSGERFLVSQSDYPDLLQVSFSKKAIDDVLKCKDCTEGCSLELRTTIC